MTAALRTNRPPAADGTGNPESDSDQELLPEWFVVALVGALAAVVGFGTVGLVLAIVGVMAPAPTLVLGVVATAAIIISVAPWRFATARGRGAHIPAGAASLVVAGATAFAIRHHAQHVLVDRDPGGYVVAARWLATHHNLEFDARTGAFAHTSGLAYLSPTVYDRGNGRLYFQFSHLLPTLLAEARWLGGDRLMFFAPALLGGLGLLAFFALATRFVRPWIAVFALAALSVDLVQVHFMRDAYSELPTQVVLLGGLWLLTRRGPPHPATWALSGLLLGATVMARVDGPLYLVAVPFAIGAAVLARRRGDAGGRAASVAAAWLAAGVVLTTAVGLIDVRVRSTKYLHDLGSRALLQYVGLLLLCAVTVGIAAWAPRLIRWPASAARGRLPDVGAVIVAIGLFGAWFLRPHLQTARATGYSLIVSLQKLDGVKVDASRRYFEYSLVWQSWYLGALTLAVGIIGAAVLTREVLRGRFGTRGLVMVTFLPVAAVYLANPNIFPDQIWVMRRFLPLIIPGFILLGFVVVDWLLVGDFAARAGERARRAVSIAARVAAAVLTLAAIAWPLHTDWPVRGDATEAGFLGPVEQLCSVLGPHAAVVVLQGGRVDLALPQTLRSYCNIPVAVRTDHTKLPELSAAGFTQLAAGWAHDGRSLFVVADTPQHIRSVVPGASPPIAQLSAFDAFALEQRIVGRPDGYQPDRYTFTAARIP